MRPPSVEMEGQEGLCFEGCFETTEWSISSLAKTSAYPTNLQHISYRLGSDSDNR
jgi:hypothetical protein